MEEPSRAFLEALAAWEETGSPEDRAAVQKAASAIFEAWQLAAAEWDRAGRSVTLRESAEVNHAAR